MFNGELMIGTGGLSIQRYVVVWLGVKHQCDRPMPLAVPAQTNQDGYNTMCTTGSNGDRQFGPQH